jgi:hypothetical protein
MNNNNSNPNRNPNRNSSKGNIPLKKNRTKRNNNNNKSKKIVNLMTVNVGVYLLGGVSINEKDFKKLPKSIQAAVNAVNLAGVSGEFKLVQKLPGAAEWVQPYYNSYLSSIIQENLCKLLLDKIFEEGPDVICTQEDVLAKNNDLIFMPIFHSLYEEKGYEVASICESHLSFSEILKAKYGEPNSDKTEGNVKLGNVIYVKKGFQYEKNTSIGNLDSKMEGTKCSAYPRCAASIKINGKSIYNVHLCGGRYDDKSVFNAGSKAVDLKINEILILTDYNNADIVLGDFNSTILPPDYNYDYPRGLKKELGKEFNNNTSNSSQNSNKNKWARWQQGAITTLLEKDYETTYFSDPSRAGTKDLEPTTNRGFTTVDWIFHKNTIKCFSNKVVHMYNDKANNNSLDGDLTDHHAVISKLQL